MKPWLLRLDHLQQREEHWAIVDLVGKGGHVRTVPVPDWVRTELDDWLAAAAIDRGKLFRRVNKVGRAWEDGMTVKAVWHSVKESARHIGVARLAPHDLRRTCARLCHASGGELEQIQFLLGHVSVQTTERYLGCKQRIGGAVNDPTIGEVCRLYALVIGKRYDLPRGRNFPQPDSSTKVPALFGSELLHNVQCPVLRQLRGLLPEP